MSQEEERATRILASAEEMIREIEQKICRGEIFFREQNLDPAALRATMSVNERKESARLLAEDLAAVENDVARELAVHAVGAAKKPIHHRTPRSMI